MSWLYQVSIAVNQCVNALLGGYADETLSSRAYRSDLRGARLGRILRPLLDRLYFWQKAHCRGAYNAEMFRRHMAKQFQDAYTK